MRAALVVSVCTPWAYRAARRYERRRREKTPLHKVLSENFENWLAWRHAPERPVPGSVKEDLRGHIECGIFCFRFDCTLCTGCDTGFVVTFCCKDGGWARHGRRHGWPWCV